MDQRNLIHPMTAGDLVESAVIVAQVPRGDGPELVLLTVRSVEWEGDSEPAPGAHPHPDQRVRITTRGYGETTTFVTKASTPLLVTGISL